MFTVRQYFWSLTNALMITAALLYGMQQLIKTDTLELSKPNGYRDVSWLHTPEDPPLKKIEKPIKPDEIEVQPKIEFLTPEFDNDVSNSINIGVLPIDPPIKGVDIYQSPQLVLMFSHPPVYPQKELARGTEGFVHIGFSVDTLGRVFDAYIIEAEPKGAFEKSALKAIKKFKYKPKYEDGVPVVSKGLSYLFRFEVEK